MLVPLALIALAACTRPSPEAPPAVQTARPSLVLVTLDTTRRDRLGAYGHAQAQTPTLDAMARHGVRFDRAYAAVPLTTPSHSSMLTGLYPPRHGVRTNGNAILPEEVQTLAEVARDHGYRTAASVAAFVTTRIWNLDQGFDPYLDRVEHSRRGRWLQERPADQVVDDAIAWLGGDLVPAEGEEPSAPVDGPFLLWVHLYDAHHPHEPPSPFREQLADPYDGEIAFMDHELARLRAAVDALGQPVHWMVLADHGEAFDMEHGEASHGLFLFEATTRVPFLIEPAEPLAAPLRVDDVVSGVDVMPTALGLLGIEVPAGLDGVDLSGVVRGEHPSRERAVYMESLTARQRLGYAAERAVVEGPYKLMDTPSPRLFDPSVDPGEAHDLSGEHPEEVARLREELSALLADAQPLAAPAPTPEAIEELAALGYVGGGFDLSGEDGTVDAKDRLATLAELDAIQDLQASGAPPQQIADRYRTLLQTEPQLAEARLGLAQALQAMGRGDEALAVYDDALRAEPDSVVLLTNQATALAEAERFEEALSSMERALAVVPEDVSARVLLLHLLSDAGRDRESLDRARAWLAANPDEPALQAHVGIMLSKFGDLEAAEPYLRASLADEVPRQFVHRTLGDLEAMREHYSEAATHFRIEADTFPLEPRNREKLALALMKQQRWEEAMAEWAFACDLAPDNVHYRRAWAQAVFNSGDYDLAAQVLQPALEQAPDDSEVLLLHANIVGKIGDHDEAVGIFERAKAARQAEQEGQPR